MGSIRIEGSNNISFNEEFKCEVIQLNNSQTTGGLIEANLVRLFNINIVCPINLNKAKEICISNVNNHNFRNLFESCKKLIIDECNECNFDLGNNLIEEMKVLKCKLTNIEGTLPNINLFVSIENIECKLPITNAIITTDEEIIELKENTKIVTDKKHLIIKNGKDVKCEIESLIKSDITFENCQSIDIALKNELIGILEFNDCGFYKKFIGYEGEYILVRSLTSLILNNSKNCLINVENVKESIHLRDSDLRLGSDNYLNVNQIEIENSSVNFSEKITCNKCVIINSDSAVEKIVYGCREELVLEKIKGVRVGINSQVRKITFEDCFNLSCNENLFGKEVKLIRCSDIKLNGQSHSIQMESCENIDFDTPPTECPVEETNYSENSGYFGRNKFVQLNQFWRQTQPNFSFSFGSNTQPFGF